MKRCKCYLHLPWCGMTPSRSEMRELSTWAWVSCRQASSERRKRTARSRRCATNGTCRVEAPAAIGGTCETDAARASTSTGECPTQSKTTQGYKDLETLLWHGRSSDGVDEDVY